MVGGFIHHQKIGLFDERTGESETFAPTTR